MDFPSGAFPETGFILSPDLIKQAGAELGQVQLKLGLDLTLMFRRFGFSFAW